MNISSESFSTDGSNSSDYFFYNGTALENSFAMTSVLDVIIVLFDFPINSYMIWLIVKGTGNGLAAEFFNLNFAVCEILLCMESLMNQFTYEDEILCIVVHFLYGLTFNGRPLFQCLICVERYLAVVHPVTFLKFKPLRYRVICSILVWVTSFVSGCGKIMIEMLQSMLCFFLSLFAQFFIFLSIQLFCLVAVLRALKQSGPGERVRDRNEENHTKRRAFYIILITTMTMLIMYVPYIILAFFQSSITVTNIFSSIRFVSFTLAGLVQPLLFLYRVGKLPIIKFQ